MALKAGSPRDANGILRLIVPPEPFESPSSRVLEARVLDHHVHSLAVALENDPILLLSLAEFVHDDRAIREIAGRIAVDCLLICKDVVHSFFALELRIRAGQDHSSLHVHPVPKAARELYGLRRMQSTQGQQCCSREQLQHGGFRALTSTQKQFAPRALLTKSES